ncbi:MAG: Endoribonuclease YbeY [Myxococcota bacterium]|nr:Endoribonuclease YbeY [Myxococcota bacterium]
MVLAGEVHVRSLKRRYFGGGSATDVLSFPAPALPGQPAPLGDLVICGPVLVRQARQHGAAIEMEALALLIHGCLHLTGWDHDTDSRRGKMMRRERAIFSAIAPGVPWPLEAEYARFNGEKQTV